MTDVQTRDEDWIKTLSWDLWMGTEPLTKLDDLLYILNVDSAPDHEQRDAVTAFTKLPAWEPAPADLKLEVTKWLSTPAPLADALSPAPDKAAPELPDNSAAALAEAKSKQVAKRRRQALISSLDIRDPLQPVRTFNPDQPRDPSGKFGSGGGGSSAPAPAAPAGRVGMGDIKLSAGDIQSLRDPETSSAAAFVNSEGVFTPERQALHDQIVSDALKGTTPSENPTYTMMGGGAASGKSSMVKSGAISTENAVVIDPDGIKLALPNVAAMAAAGDTRWAAMGHEESSYVAKRVSAAALETNRSVVLDGTGDSSIDKLNGKINAARAAGYKVNGAYCTVNVDTAIQRAGARAEKTGRVVPEPTIRALYSAISVTLPACANSFDSLRLYDNNGSSLKLIASSEHQGGFAVSDQGLYNDFLGNHVEGLKLV